MSVGDFFYKTFYMLSHIWYVHQDAFTKPDPLTDHTYVRNGFHPATEVEHFSYTSGRVLTPVYNVYAPSEFLLFGYYTDWSQYDGRLDNADAPNAACGRGVDMMTVAPTAYDKIIVGFAAIVGDRGPKQAAINTAASQLKRLQNEVTFLDPWGDVQAYRNDGFPGYKPGNPIDLFVQKAAQGCLGGLRKLWERNPQLILSFSVGGWTMSEAFHRVAADEGATNTFAASIVDIFTRFPMFKEVDLDWEYPNAAGREGQPFGPEDPANFARLVETLRTKLAAAGRSDVLISVAVSGAVEKLKAGNVRLLLDAGVHGFNVMTYDFFGTPWASKLAHHTNLYSNDSWSVEAAVDYLLEVGIPSKQIFIGYAGYSRNARNTHLDSVSPLRGTYSPGQGTTVGSFESGTTEYPDVLYNYLDAGAVRGKNDFVLYTDEVANADFLYNPKSSLFMSIDTPRSAKAKGEYVRERNLGGLFTWTIESDKGLLVNAAREGLGQKVMHQTISMARLYGKGRTSL